MSANRVAGDIIYSLTDIGPNTQNVAGINNSGQVTGTIGNIAYRWTPGQGIQTLDPLPPPAYESNGNAISDNGDVVGALRSYNPFGAFVWTPEAGTQAVSKADRTRTPRESILVE